MVVKAVISHPSEAMRRLMPMVIGAFFVWLLWSKAQNLDWNAVQASFDEIPRWRWTVSALATMISFWAVAQYDVIAHRHFQTGISPRAARHIGGAAIAVGQTTGFGPFVGAAIRWRIMPELGHKTVAKLTGFVTLGFFAAWALLTLSVALPILLGLPWLALLLVPVIGLSVAGFLLRYPNHRMLGRGISMPSLPAMGAMTVLAACDLLFAGVALYVLLPSEMAPPILSLVAAFSIALGAGMIGGTPGGVGPFEMALVFLIPSPDLAPLAAALIAFRLIYYVAPCLAGIAFAGLAATSSPSQSRQITPQQSGPRAEHTIATQAVCHQLENKGNSAIVLETPQTLTLFLSATKGHIAPLLFTVRKAAIEQNRVACLYKIVARDATVVRKAGWQVVALAQEAIVAPQTYCEKGSQRRQLRRFLRKAEKANIRFERMSMPDWGCMADIHHEWEQTHGAERGLTMGRFCPLYLQDKPLFGAYDGDKLIAFASLVEAPGVQSLDLMRHGANIPTGTMHGLIHHMICDARKHSIHEFNLAAVPHPTLVQSLRLQPGLSRFKASFGPKWRPLYIAAPSKPALVLAALDLWLGISRPQAIPYGPMDAWQIDAMLTGETAAIPENSDMRLTG